MSQLNTIIATQIDTAAVAVENKVASSAASTKDFGRVKVGGVCIRFNSAPAMAKDAGRVKVGGVCIRF